MPPARLLKRQPKGSARINWSNPRTRGLVAAYTNGREFVSGRSVRVSSGLSPKADPAGFLSDTFAQGGGQFLDLGNVVGNSGPLSYVVWAYDTGGNSADNSIVSYGDYGTLRNTGFDFYTYNGTGWDTVSLNSSAYAGAGLYKLTGVHDGSNNYFEGYYPGSGGYVTASAAAGSRSSSTQSVRLGDDTTNSRSFNGTVPVVLVFNRALTANERRSLVDNPWQVFAQPYKGLVVNAPASGVTGTLAWTEADDTASITGSLTVSGSLSWTEANDTASVTGSVQVSGSASWTEANDTASLTGSLTVSGAPIWTESNDTASLSGTLTVSGSIAWTEDNDTAALTGTVGNVVTGSASWVEADDAASVAGSLTASGSASWVESNDSWSLSGQVTQPSSGALAWSESNDSWLVDGLVTQPASGVISWSEDDDLWNVLGLHGGGGNAWDKQRQKRRAQVQAEVNRRNLEILKAELAEKSEIAEALGFDDDDEEALMLLL